MDEPTKTNPRGLTVVSCLIFAALVQAIGWALSLTIMLMILMIVGAVEIWKEWRHHVRAMRELK